MVDPFLFALFDCLLNNYWLISCDHTVQPMNLAWKRQHEELTS
jgi:hypothetical protein